MSDIKTKEKVKGVRALDKSKELGQRMKSGLVKTKQKMDDLTDDGQVTAEEYANDRMQEMAGSAAEHKLLRCLQLSGRKREASAAVGKL